MMKKFGMFAPMAAAQIPPAVQEDIMGPPMGVSAPSMPPQPTMQQGVQPQQKQGLFSPDLAEKLSVIGAMLMQNAGNPLGGQIVGNYYQKQENDRLMQQRSIAAEQERLQGREDKQWEWANKPQDAPDPTSLQRNYEWLKAQNPEFAEQYLQSQTTAPPLVIDNGDGTKTIYPAGAIPQNAQPAPSAGGIQSGMVVTPEIWESANPLPTGTQKQGGQTPQASGSF